MRCALWRRRRLFGRHLDGDRRARSAVRRAPRSPAAGILGACYGRLGDGGPSASPALACGSVARRLRSTATSTGRAYGMKPQATGGVPRPVTIVVREKQLGSGSTETPGGADSARAGGTVP